MQIGSPPEYIEHFKNSSTYLEVYRQLNNLDQKEEQCRKDFKSNLSQPTTADRLLISGIENTTKIQQSILKLYLYYRLNRWSWFRFIRLIYSLANKLFPRKPTRYSNDLNFITNKTDNDGTSKYP